jgi:hypothetical protein
MVFSPLFAGRGHQEGGDMSYTAKLHVPIKSECALKRNLVCTIFGSSCALISTQIFPVPCPFFEPAVIV